MKQIKLENLITKRKRLDKRLKFTKEINRWFNEKTRASAIVSLLVTILCWCPTIEGIIRPPKVLGKTIIEKTSEVTTQEINYDIDLIKYFRIKGMEIGYDEYDITKLHGLLDCENGTHDPKRKNYAYDGENGHYTAGGVAMITNTTWKQHKCSGNKWDGTDNIDCFYKIIGKNKLSDYNESKSCWIKKFNPNDIVFINIK